MLNAKISPSQIYWLPKVIQRYKNDGWTDIDVRLTSFSDCVIYERADIRIEFVNSNRFLIVYIDHLGKDRVVIEGER